MSRFVVITMLALGSIVGACSKSTAGGVPVHVFPKRVAWAGVAANGLRIVVEPIAETVHAPPAIASEDDLLRDILGISEGEQLLRVVLRPDGESGLPQKRGSVQVGTVVYQPFTVMPEGLDVRGRLIWNSVVTGGRELVPAAGELLQWSYLLVATTSALPTAQDRMSWQSGALRVELQSQTWSESERQQFLDANSPKEDE